MKFKQPAPPPPPLRLKPFTGKASTPPPPLTLSILIILNHTFLIAQNINKEHLWSNS